MKRIIFALLVACLAVGASADPITREQARLRAEQFLQNVGGSRQLSPVQNRAKLAPRRNFSVTAPDHELYYVFNRGEGEGYVIAAGDDSTYPVLGYTTGGEFDYTRLPDGMKWWLGWMTDQLQDLADNPVPAGTTIRRAALHPRVAPLCTSRWNQGSPYNDECPMYFSLGRSITGCVATAMAQILYFHRAKSVTEVQKDIPGYSTWTAHPTYGNLKVEGIPAGSPIDWDNMIDNYGSNASAKQKKAVAQLMHYCGVAVHMDYTNSSSGAQSSEVDDALRNYFGYGNSVKYISLGQTPSSADWDNWDATLYNEVAAGRPVYLSGSNDEGGHAFVCDGYDGNYCFHINWGWGGSSDNYFLLTKLNPSSQGLGGSSGGYSGWPEAVIGIEPENYATRAMPITNATVRKICLESFDADADGTVTFGEIAAVTDLGEAFKGQRFTAFNELYNFTGLTTLSEGAFEGCTSLSAIKLPKNLKTIGARAFKGCTALKTFVMPSNLTAIDDEAFDGCKAFTFTLPASIQHIGDAAFRGCAAQGEVELPIGVKSLGAGAFADCTKLSTVTLRSIRPQEIQLGADVFQGVDLAAATLNVPQGTKTAISAAAQWKDFGTIYEMRDLSRGQFVEPTTGKRYYLYNVGTGRYLTGGEAWGTQAIVAQTDNPMRFELRKTAAMPEGVYYLYSDDTEGNNHILFRTATDNQVGSGVRACFVDGANSHISDKTSWWKLSAVEGVENTFTLQVPSGVAGYKATQFLGVNPDHASNVASPTYGIYSDILIEDFTDNCRWMFVEYDEQAQQVQQGATQLANLLTLAAKKRIDVTREQAVYDDLNSSVDDILRAQRRLRKKLGYIHFESDVVRQAAFDRGCDLDGDYEITQAEAAMLPSFETYFGGNSEITTLPDLKYFTGLEYLAGNGFKDCSSLTDVTLPDGIENFYYRVFMGCSSLASIVLPSKLAYIGDDCFHGCEALRAVTVQAADPAIIELGSDVFFGVDLSAATLYVPYGSAALYRESEVWQDFGNIVEVRAPQDPSFQPLAENETLYVYNVGYRRSICAGEAYGTQAVVGNTGLLYQLRRSKAMPENTYYLYATDYKGSNKVLFRTSTDSKVGEGVKACFVDGSSGASAYWMVRPVEGEQNVYTFQVPENQNDYVEDEYLGIDINHVSEFAGYNNTYGLYWDINYYGNEEACHWAFISKEEADSLQQFFQQTQQLKQLIARADERSIDAAAERAVYDDFGSSQQQILDAIASLRSKLHYITFADAHAQSLALNAWDADEDDELSLEEAAAVTDLGTTFNSASTVTSLEELRYFTALTAIGDEAFRSCSKLLSIYLPAGVRSVGEKAFTTTTALRYMAVLNPSQVVDLSASGLTARNLTLFVPAALQQSYNEAAYLEAAVVKEYTGTPVVAAEAVSRQYGRSNPKLTFVVSGAPVNGTPQLSTEAENTTPVGDYPIQITAGDITSPGLQLQTANLTVEPAEVTITAESYTRNVGEANPDFAVNYSAFRNREKADEVLLHEAVCECDATPDSPAGEYEIRVSGAEAANYVFEYVNGVLTVIDPTGVRDLGADASQSATFDLSGRRVSRPTQRGIYITRGKKAVK